MEERRFLLNRQKVTNNNLCHPDNREKYFDATLGCIQKCPKKLIISQAHQYLLAASSPLLSDLLSENKQDGVFRPFIYLHDVNYEDLDHMLHLIYNGYVTVITSRSETFIRTVNRLQIKIKEFHFDTKDYCKEDMISCSKCNASLAKQFCDPTYDSKVNANEPHILNRQNGVVVSPFIIDNAMSEKEKNYVHLAIADIEDIIKDTVSYFHDWKTWTLFDDIYETESMTSNDELLEIENALKETNLRMAKSKDHSSTKKEENSLRTSSNVPWDFFEAIKCENVDENEDYTDQRKRTVTNFEDRVLPGIVSSPTIPASCSSIFEECSYKMPRKKKKNKGKQIEEQPSFTKSDRKLIKPRNIDYKPHVKNLMIKYPISFERIIDIMHVKYPKNYESIENLTNIKSS